MNKSEWKRSEIGIPLGFKQESLSFDRHGGERLSWWDAGGNWSDRILVDL